MLNNYMANFALLRFAAGAAQRRALIVGLMQMMMNENKRYANAVTGTGS